MYLPTHARGCDAFRALRSREQASNVWYGHAYALTWVQPQLPDGFEGTTYDDSGWVCRQNRTTSILPSRTINLHSPSPTPNGTQCFVEASLSSVLKSGERRLDLAKFTSEELFYPNVPHAIENCVKGSRPPVRLPSRVAELLETKTFFARADVATVAGLYRDFFEAVAPATRDLHLSKLGWGDTEVAELAAALPSFANLTSLKCGSPSNRGCKLAFLATP